MRLVLALLLVLACPAVARAGSVVLPPAADVGLPFWCDWGYDWDERCYRDDGARLPVGGVDDKTWRSALLSKLPTLAVGARVSNATLRLYFDRTCVAARLRSAPCTRPYTLDAHRILSESWTAEREVEIDWVVSGSVATGPAASWVSLDVTELVRARFSGFEPNNGLLLKLAEGEEDLGVGGPCLPSSSFTDAALRPRLVVTYG
jgi:hypothetical protein